MKVPLLILSALLILAGDALAARDEAAIREVAEGTRTEARAEWWGFDAADATSAVQSAIDSKAKRVVIGNTGAPWNVRRIKLASDQELVLEKGVVLQAVRGEFKSKHHMLLRGDRVKNLTISGEGATLRMWKSDYQAAPYEKSEWRHALALYACENVTVRGLTIAESGGDGIYLGAAGDGGPCKQVTIQDVTCRANHRQGISVISAEDLLIEKCTFSETQGTAPQAGIDFEPNSSRERLKNCVLRHCTFRDNRSYGILFALGQLAYESEPVSIRLEDCRTLGNAGAVLVSVRNPAGPRGQIDFEDGWFLEKKRCVEIHNKAAQGIALRFAKCKFYHEGPWNGEGSPIDLKSSGEAAEAIGGIHFENCSVAVRKGVRPLSYDDVGGARLKQITGNLEVIENDAAKKTEETTEVKLTQAVLDEWFPWSADLKEYAHFDMQALPFTPGFIHARRPFPAAAAWQRGTAQYLLSGRESGGLDFSITIKQIGTGELKPLPVKLITPAGQEIALAPAEGTKPTRYTYKATEAGLHRLICEAGAQTVSLDSPNDIACLVAARGSFHFVGAAGPLHFVVPAGVKDFGINVAGGGGTELVKATISDAHGKIVAAKDNIGRSERFPFTRADATHAEVWSLKLERPSQGVLEDVFVLLAGVPGLLSSAPETTLQPASATAPPLVFREPQVVLIGDSLVSSYPNPPPDRPTLTGWGQVLGEFLRPGVGVRNEARSGASTKSFLMRGFWQKTVDGPTADFLLIQFGGNDSKPDDRFADPATTYRDFLRGYIALGRALGMKPVLVSSPVSRTFDPHGKIITTLDAYFAAMRQVAAEEKVPFIDLQAKSKAYFEKLGPKECEKYNASAEDHTHFSRDGALAMARLAAEGLREAGGEYAGLVGDAK